MCVCVCVYKILPCILIFIIFEGLFLLTQILMFFQRVCAGCVLRVILFMYWLANSLICISEISNCVWELSLSTPISNKFTQLNICLSARKQTDVFVIL